MIHLSVLDFGHPGASASLMTQADQLGYSRYWLGEHHTKLQCGSPLLLGSLLAATSDGIRVGSGGVCLRYHSPYQVAAEARLIEFMLPDRFDLGITRGLPLDPDRAEALLDGRSGDPEHYARLAELHGFVTGRLEPDHPMRLRALPLEPGPPMWILGTSLSSAKWAAAHGTGFCLSLHHGLNEGEALPLLEEYRRGFVPSPEFRQPAEIVTISALGQEGGPLTAAGASQPDTELRPTVSGSIEQIAESLYGLATKLKVRELMVLDLYTLERSLERGGFYEALAEEWGLERRQADDIQPEGSR